MDIPLIDFSSYDDDADSLAPTLVEQVTNALRDVGFMTVTNIGIDASQLDSIFTCSHAFFECDEDFKQQYRYRDAGENFGYQSLAKESLDPGTPGDLKETFTLRLNPNTALAEDRFPSAEFKNEVTNFYSECMAAAFRIMRVMAQIFGLPPDFFTASVSGENVALRLLHYPSGQHNSGSGQLGAGAHTDYGVITLLFQDGVSGLEVRDRDGIWQTVPCVPNAVVINTGDLIHRWTNGYFRSTAHRVKPIFGPRDRYSIAFFVDPDSDTLVKVLPQCIDAQNPARYPPITAGEHIRQKLKASHN